MKNYKIVFLLLLVFSFYSGCSNQSTAEKSIPAQKLSEKVSKTGTIKAPLDTIAIAISELALDDWSEAEAKKNIDRKVLMLKHGEVLSVPRGEKVFVLEDKGGKLKIDILTGSRKGKVGWVSSELIQIDALKK